VITFMALDKNIKKKGYKKLNLHPFMN